MNDDRRLPSGWYIPVGVLLTVFLVVGWWLGAWGVALVIAGFSVLIAWAMSQDR
jgi:hypothetical protein